MDRRTVEVTYPFSSISPTFPYRAINRSENVQNKRLCGAECLKVGLFPNLLCNQRLKSAGHFKHRWGIKPFVEILSDDKDVLAFQTRLD